MEEALARRPALADGHHPDVLRSGVFVSFFECDPVGFHSAWTSVLFEHLFIALGFDSCDWRFARAPFHAFAFAAC